MCFPGSFFGVLKCEKLKIVEFQEDKNGAVATSRARWGGSCPFLGVVTAILDQSMRAVLFLNPPMQFNVLTSSAVELMVYCREMVIKW